MILKFRESTISRLERLRKREKEGSDTQEDEKDREIVSTTLNAFSHSTATDDGWFSSYNVNRWMRKCFIRYEVYPVDERVSEWASKRQSGRPSDRITNSFIAYAIHEWSVF